MHLVFYVLILIIFRQVNSELRSYIDQMKDQSTRCDFLCQNDESCRSGRCVLTQCFDTESCFRYCFYCDYVEKCYEAGPYCYLFNQKSSARRLSFNSFSVFLIIGLLYVVC